MKTRVRDTETGRIKIAYHIANDGTAYNKTKTVRLGIIGLDLSLVPMKALPKNSIRSIVIASWK